MGHNTSGMTPPSPIAPPESRLPSSSSNDGPASNPQGACGPSPFVFDSHGHAPARDAREGGPHEGTPENHREGIEQKAPREEL